MPSVCSVCSGRQHVVEMHDVVLNSKEEIPEYLSILRNEDKSAFFDGEIRFADLRDPDGSHANEECTPLRVCHPVTGTSPATDDSLCSCKQTVSRTFAWGVSGSYMDRGTGVSRCEVSNTARVISSLPIVRLIATCCVPQHPCTRDEPWFSGDSVPM